MRLLLLNPPTREGKGFIREGRCTQEGGVWTTLWPPVSLATMAAVLEQAGHRVQAVDAGATGASRDQILRQVRRETPGAVIWSSGTPSIDDDLALAGELKQVAPGLRTAVFGTHVTALDRQSMEHAPELDAIFRAEPEQTALEWVNCLDNGEALTQVAGLTFRSERGIERNPDRPFLKDLDSLPDPAWHLFDLDAYRLPLKASRFLMVVPHRGCPYPCTYCTAQTYYGGKLRRRSVECVVEEIRRDVARYGVREFFFWSDTFTIDKRYVMELSQAIEPLQVGWAANSRVDTIDAEMAAGMRRAGCWMISLGIESGDQARLDEAGKGATVEQAETAVEISKAAGLQVAGHFVLGLPGETRGSLERTLRLARRLPLDFVQFYCAVPFPGSRLYGTARSRGWLEHTDFSRFRQDEAVMSLPTLSADEVMLYRQRAYREFYLQPRVALRILGLLSPRHVLGLLGQMRRFVRWARMSAVGPGRWPRRRRRRLRPTGT